MDLPPFTEQDGRWRKKDIVGIGFLLIGSGGVVVLLCAAVAALFGSVAEVLLLRDVVAVFGVVPAYAAIVAGVCFVVHGTIVLPIVRFLRGQDRPSDKNTE